jgi:hypothetical protein
LMSRLPIMLPRYCLSDFETLPVAPNIIDIIFALKFHVLCFSIVRCLYFLEFSRLLFLPHFYPEHTCCLYQNIMDYDGRFIDRGGSVGLRFLIP